MIRGAINRAREIVERVHGLGDGEMRFEHFRAALVDPLYRRIDTLFGDRLICTRPHRVLAMQLERIGHLYKPAVSERIKTNKEYIFETTVLRAGTGVFSDVVAGDRIVVSQFAGSVWYDVERGRETELWLFASGDIILKLIADANERTQFDDVIDHCIHELDHACGR